MSTIESKITSKSGVIAFVIADFILLAINIFLIYAFGKDVQHKMLIGKFFIWAIIIIISCAILFLLYACSVCISSKDNSKFLLQIFLISFVILLIQLYGDLYLVVELLDYQNGITSFIFNSQPEQGEEVFDLFYYSCMTFTTVGFGDITPLSRLAKIFTMSESLLLPIVFTFIIGKKQNKALINKNSSNNECEQKHIHYHISQTNNWK